jgi:hypothetical protein
MANASSPTVRARYSIALGASTAHRTASTTLRMRLPGEVLFALAALLMA